jgi:hypothetical protein
MSTMIQPTSKPQQAFLLHEAIIEQAAAKVGLFGPQGSGKTTTAALIAIGLSKTYHNGAPVAFMDTENGSDYLVPIFEMEGVPLFVIKSRAFKDLAPVLREAAERGCCVDLIDSYTHPWWELNDSLKATLRVQKLQFEHQDQLKSLWRGWTDVMLNSPLHVVMCGRLGYVWDRQEDENGRKANGELIKLGTKMKSESEAGYEPSLLVEMEGIQDSALRVRKSRAKRGTITHHAYVLKDRWRALNGHTFQWPDINEYKAGDWKKVFDKFLPHFAKLAIGKQQRAVNASRTSDTLFDGQGDSAYHQRVRQVQITLEEIEGTLVTLWPGQDAKSKELKRVAIETLFGTRSWTAVESMRLEDLEVGLRTLQAFESAIKTSPALQNALTEKTDAIALLEQSKYPVGEPVRGDDPYSPTIETPAPIAAAPPAVDETPVERPESSGLDNGNPLGRKTESSSKSRSRKSKLEHPEFISPRESMILVRTATRLGWSTSDFVSALVERFGIAGPDFIPAEKWEEVMQMIEGGTEPASEPQIVLQGMPVLPVGGAR